MSSALQSTPGLTFESVKAPGQADILRTDIAGFCGGTVRGPLGELVRVTGWREFQTIFGPVSAGYDLPLSLQGYFENGGEIAHVMRLAAPTSQPASAMWTVGEVNAVNKKWLSSAPGKAGFTHFQYQLSAKSPGMWGDDLKVSFHYLQSGRNESPELKVLITTALGEEEYIEGIHPSTLASDISRRSQLISIDALAGKEALAASHRGPAQIIWRPIVLRSASEGEASKSDYLSALHTLIDEPEIALLALPDLYRLPEADVNEIFAKTAAFCDRQMDRQFIASPPDGYWNKRLASEWVNNRRLDSAGLSLRSASIYFPWLKVEDPVSNVIEPLREISPVGHVAGLISRMDRERGAHHTPANGAIYQALDLAQFVDEVTQAHLFDLGVNLIPCRVGRGLQVWGGRTFIDSARYPEFIWLAHRRLLQRLVRAMRRVAEPLVFSTNDPQTWLALVRALTSVLLQAFRAGALKGDRPEEAFRVVCDETNNPEHLRDEGHVYCDICVAPAVPMEFITLRINLGREGRLEIIQA